MDTFSDISDYLHGLVGTMKNANNDNDTWLSIGLAAALILNKFQNASRLLPADDVREIYDPVQRVDREEQQTEKGTEAEEHKALCRALA